MAAGTLSVDVTGAGPIWIKNQGDLDLTHAASFDGDVTFAVTGNLIARDIVAGATAQNAITLGTTPIAAARDANGLALRTIQVGTLTAQTVALSAATTIAQLSASSITADTLTLVSNEGIDLSGLAIGTLDARVEGVGDMTLATLADTGNVPGTLTVARLVTQDGLITLTSARNIVLQGYEADTTGVISGVVAGRSADRTPQSTAANPVVDLADLPLDVSLTSTQGSISGTGAIPHIKVDTDTGGAIELIAAAGLLDLSVEAAELRNLRTDAGGISLTEVGSDRRTQTLLTSARADAGDITITTNEALEVLGISGQTNATSVTLTAKGGELFAKGQSGTLLTARSAAGVINATGLLANVTLDAADALVIDGGLWVDARNAVTFITGADFVIPTQRGYDAVELVINSAASINATAQIRVGRDADTTRVEMQSGKNITLNAPISSQQGSFVDQVVLNARGDVAESVQVYSEVSDMRVVTGASGAEYLEGLDINGNPDGTYKTDRVIEGSTVYYVLDAVDYRFDETFVTPATGDQTPILVVPKNNPGTLIKVLSTSPTGDGAIYSVVTDVTTGAVTRGAAVVQSTGAVYLAGGVVIVKDRSFVDVTPLAKAERPSMTISGLTSDGTLSVDLASTANSLVKTTVTADVNANDLTALADAITAAAIGITATLSSDKASIVMTRADSNGILLTGFNHVPTVAGTNGSILVEGTNLASVRILVQSQKAVADALAHKFEQQYSSRIELFQGQTPFNDMTITASSPAGTTNGDIVFVAGSDVDLDKVKTYATGNIQVTTTAGANVGDVMTLEDDQGQVYAYKVLTADDLTGSLDFTPGTLANGTYALTVWLRDPFGNASASSGKAEFTVTNSTASTGFAAPAKPVITAPGTVGSARFALQGTGATAWTRIEIRDNATNALIAQTRADQNGNWSALTPILADGTHSVYAVNLADKASLAAPDVAGPRSATVTFTVDTHAPAVPTMTYTATGSALSGTAEAGSTVNVYANDDLKTPVFTTTANSSGNWSGTLDTTAGTLANGVNFLTVRSSDAVGNHSGYSGSQSILIGQSPAPSLTVTGQTTAFDPVTVTRFFEGYRLSGTTDVGARVQVQINDTTREAWVEGNTWQYVLDDTDATNLTASSGVFKVLADDPLAGTAAAEYSGTLTLALTAPTVAFSKIEGITSGTTTITKANVDSGNAISLQGTASTTTIDIIMANGVTLKSGVGVSSGTWSYQLTGADYALLGNGTQTLSYVATDAAGNTTTAQASLTIAVVKPANAVIDRVNDDTGLDDYFTTDANGLEVFGTSEPGSTITLTYTWVPKTGTTKTDVAVTGITYVNPLTGVWRATLPETGEGEYTIKTLATKEGISSDPVEKRITVDITPPAIPTITAADPTAGRPAISGTAEAGAVVSIVDGSTVIANTRALTDGTWTWAPTSVWQAGVARTLTAFVTDAAGNQGTASGGLTLTPVNTTVALSFTPVTGDNIITTADRTSGITIGGESSAAVLYVVVNGTTKETVNLGQSVGGSITLTNTGKGYSSTALPSVTFSAPPSGGEQATGTAVVENGVLTGITITNFGSGYLVPPTVTIGAPVPVTAVPGVSLNGTGVALASGTGGSGYTAAPTVTIGAPDGTNAAATASVSGGVVTFTISDQGSGYSNQVAVTVSDGTTTVDVAAVVSGGKITALSQLTGTGFTSASVLTVSIVETPVQAVATATVTNGVVTGYTVATAGSRYATVPTVTVDAPVAVQAIAQNAALSTVPKAWTHVLSDTLLAQMGRVESANITSGGINFTAVPTVTFSAPASGVTAEGIAVLDSSGAISEITITNPGSGYTSPPDVTITSTDGTGAPTLATAQLSPTASITVLDAATTSEVQEINLSAVTGGTYTFTFTLDGKEYRSGAISYNETDAAVIEETLTRMGVPGADYSVGSIAGNTYRITFGGSLQYRDVPALELDATALTVPTGGAAPTVTENPDGDAKYAVTHIVDWVLDTSVPLDASDTTPLVIAGVTQANELTGPTVYGTAPAGATVGLFAGSTEITGTNTVADASGNWTISLIGLGIADNTSLVAKITTGLDAGVVTSAPVAYTAAAPSISVTEVIRNNIIAKEDLERVLQIRGLAGIDATAVTLKLSNDKTISAELFPEEEAQNWRIKLTLDDLALINDGTVTLEFIVTNGTDTASLSQTVTLDRTAPTETPTISTIQGAAVTANNLATSSRPTIAGSGALASGVVRVFDLTSSTLLGETTADSSGAWTLTPADYDKVLSSGTHSIGAVSIDAAGNFGTLSAAKTLVIDLGTVAAPAIVGLGNDTGRPLDNATGETKPVIKGTSAAGTTIEIFVDGSTTAVNAGTSVTANAQGQWSYTLTTALTEGNHSITAKASFGGASSGLSTALDIEIDTTVAKPVFTTTAATVATATPSLRGTAEALAKVTVYRTVGTGTDVEVIGETVADVYGVWRLEPSTKLPDGVQTLKAKTTDAVGNVSVYSADLVMTVETRTPSITFGAVNGDDTISLGDKSSTGGVTLTGWVDSGASVTISIGRNSASATVDAATGRWVYTLKQVDFDEIGIADGVALTATASSALGTKTVVSRIVDFKTQVAAIPAQAVVQSSNAGTVTLQSAAGEAGKISGSELIYADSITLNSASDIDVRTSVNTMTVTAAGTSVKLVNSKATELDVTQAEGSLEVQSSGTLVIRNAQFENNVASNDMLFLAGDTGALDGEEAALRARLKQLGFTDTQINAEVKNHNVLSAFESATQTSGLTGGVLIDYINAGQLGDVTIKTSGDVREVLVDDAVDILNDSAAPAYAPATGVDLSKSYDVVAGSFTAYGRNKAENNSSTIGDVTRVTQLEFSEFLKDHPGNVSIGWQTWNNAAELTTGDYTLAGYYDGAVDLQFADADVSIVGLHSTSGVTINSKSVDVTGTISANNAITVTGGAGGVVISEGGQLTSRTASTIAVTASQGDIEMRSGSVIRTTGAVSLTSTLGNVSLGHIEAANPVTITAAQAITNSDLGVLGTTEVTNIETNGSVTLQAGQGVGTLDNALVLATDTISKVAGGTGHDVHLDLRTSGTVTIGNLTGNAAGISSTGNLIAGSTGWTLAGNLTIDTAGSLTQTGAMVVGGQTDITSGTGVTLEHAGNDFASVTVDAQTVSITDTNALTLGGNAQTLNVSAGADLTLTTTQVAGAAQFAATGALTGTDAITVGTTTSLTSGTGKAISLTGSNDFGGQVTVNSGADLSLTDLNALTLAGTVTGGATVTSGAAMTLGALDVGANATLRAGGTLSDNGNAISVAGTTSLETENGAAIVLDGTNHGFVGSVTIVSAGSLALTNTNPLSLGGDITGAATLASLGKVSLGTTAVGGALTLDGDGADLGNVTVAGALAVTSTGAVTNSGILTVGGDTTLNAAGQSVSLTNAENDFVGAVTVTGADTVALNDSNALTVGGTVAQGLTIGTGGALTLTSTTLGSAGTATGQLSITSGGSVGQTDGTALTVHGTTLIDAASNDVILSQAGNDFTGTVTITGANIPLEDRNVPGARNIDLRDVNAIELGEIAAFGDVKITANGEISQKAGTSTGLDIAGKLALDTGTTGADISLTHADNVIDGDVTIAKAQNVEIVSNSALHIVSANILGDLTLTSSGKVYNADAWVVDGNTYINAAGQDVTLTADHDFKGSVTIIARNLTINDINGINFGALTLSGSLSVTAGGAITSSGAITVAGRTSLKTTGGAAAIDLQNAGNDFQGAVSVAGLGQVALRDANGIILGNSTVGSTLSVLAGGTITDNGGLTVTGAASFDGTDVILDSADNDFYGAVSASGSAVTLRDATALVLGDVKATGALNVVTVGALTGSGKITVGATTTLNSNGAAIVLTNAASDYTGLVSVIRAGDISLVDATDLSFTGSAQNGGSLTLTAGGLVSLIGTVSSAGNMTIEGGSIVMQRTNVGGDLGMTTPGSVTQTTGTALSVVGKTDINANSLSLTTSANSFVGAVSLTVAAAADLRTIGNLDLGASILGHSLTVVAGGQITQSAAIAVSGALTLTAGAGKSITLVDAANSFGGGILVDADKDLRVSAASGIALRGRVAGDLGLTATGAVDLAALTVGGTLTLTGGSLTDSGTVTIAGATTLATGSGNITLDNGTHFGGALGITSAGNVSVLATGALTLGDVTTSGTVSLDVAGAVTQAAGTSVSFGGAGDITVGSGKTITLTQAGNLFGGTLDLTAQGAEVTATGVLSVLGTVGAGGLKLRGDDAVILGALTVGADLTITTTGAISQTGAIAVSMTTTLAAGNAGDITLANAANELGDLVVLTSAKNVTLADSTGLTLRGETSGALNVTTGDAITLGTLTSGGDLAVIAAGSITQETAADVLYVGGTTTLTAADATTTYDLTLANVSDDGTPLNEFIGDVTILNAANVVLRDRDELTIGVTATGDATIFAQTRLFLGASDVAGIMEARGNFTLSGDVIADTLQLLSTNFYDMAGYTATARTGDIIINAEADIMLGQLVALDGDVYLSTKTGKITDGLVDGFGNKIDRLNIVTGAQNTVTLIAGAGRLDVKLWAVGADRNTSNIEAVPGTIDVSAFAISDVKAPDGVSLSIGVGNKGKFQGVLTTAGNLDLDLGAEGIEMAAGSALRAGGDVTITSTADLMLAEISAGADQVISITTTGSVAGLTNANGKANVAGGTILLDVQGDLGTSLQPLTLDALGSGAGGNGVVRLVATPANATLNIITPRLGDVVPTVELGTPSVDWTVGGHLTLTATQANLLLQGNISASDITIAALEGSLTMVAGKAVRSDGTIILEGASGLNLSNVEGSATDADQEIRLASANGNIRDLTVDELANITTAGRLTLTGASIGTQGVGDIDVIARALKITTTSDNAGGATLESLVTTGTVLESATTTGALALTVNRGDLFVTGDAKVGGLILNLGATTTPLNTRNIVQADGTTIESLSAATLIATGDIKLSRLSVLTGDATLNAKGRILDVNSAVDGAGVEVANIVMGSGALTAEALSIGTTAPDGDIDVDVSKIASLVATDTVAGQHITVTSYSGTTLSELDTVGRASFVQAGGDLTLDGTVRVQQLEMSVEAGSLTQTSGAKLFVTDDIALTTSGDMSLSGITSLEGNVTLRAGGAILDNSTDRETAIITTSQAGKTVSLTAGSIGTSAEGGQIEVSTDKVALAKAGTGGVFVTGLKSIEFGPVQAASGNGNVALGASAGNLTLTDRVLGNAAVVFADSGAITMATASSIDTRMGATVTAGGGDLVVTSITATDAGSRTILTASGALLDGLPDEPSTGWNVDAAGLVELSATTIGTAADAFDVKTDAMNSVTAAGDVALSLQSQTGTVTLATATLTPGALTLNVSGDLRIAQAVRADSVKITATGAITQDEVSKITTTGDLHLAATGDITLGALQTSTGTVTVDAGTIGRVLDGTAGEAPNITGLGTTAVAVLIGRSVGTKTVVDGINLGDLDLDIATVGSITAGDGGIYLGSVRDLRLKAVTSTGEMELLVDEGNLTLDGIQSVLRAKIDVAIGGLTQTDGSILTATGTTGAGRITVAATRDIALSRMVAHNGDMSISTTGGKSSTRPLPTGKATKTLSLPTAN